MILYHGSVVAVRCPNITNGRSNTDFGKGFYTTTDFEQAARWAKLKKQRSKARTAIVSVFELDDAVLNNGENSVMEYSGATGDWLDFVVENRKGKAKKHFFDFIKGPVANDNLYLTINLYEQGQLSKEAAIVQLKTNVLFDQLSFHTQRAVATLHFVKYIIIE